VSFVVSVPDNLLISNQPLAGTSLNVCFPLGKSSFDFKALSTQSFSQRFATALSAQFRLY